MTGADDQGETLAARLRRERTLAPAVAAEIVRGAAAALAGRVHGALAPERLSLVGSRLVVREGGESEPAYRAPELWAGGAADARTDVYALGCILYRALVGVPPFPGPEDADFADQHQAAPAPRPGMAHPELAPFDAIVRRALAKAAAERWADADALAGALPGDRAARTPPGPSRAWWVAALAAAVAAAGAGALMWPRPPPPAPVVSDAAPPRRWLPLEPLVTIGACRSATAPVPAPGHALRALRALDGGSAGDIDVGEVQGGGERGGELKPFPVDALAREYRRKAAPGYLRQHRPELARCYRAALARTPPPAAVVTLALTLAADGTVASAGVTGLGEGSVETCLAGVARGTSFAPPPAAPFELRCPIALAYVGDMAAGAPGAAEIADDAPAAEALAALSAARASAPARRAGGAWAALGVLLEAERATSPSPGRPVLPRAVSVFVTADAVRIGTVAGASNPVARFPAGDLASVRARLAAIRAEDEFADVLWVEVAAGPGVRWDALVPVIEAARDAGFPVVDPRAGDELSAEL